MHRHHVYTYMYVRGKAPWLELSTALALHGALHGVLLLREELGDCHLPFQGLRAHKTKSYPHHSHPTCLERALRRMLGACVAHAWARLWGASRLCAWALSSVSLGGAHTWSCLNPSARASTASTPLSARLLLKSSLMIRSAYSRKL